MDAARLRSTIKET